MKLTVLPNGVVVREDKDGRTTITTYGNVMYDYDGRRIMISMQDNGSSPWRKYFLKIGTEERRIVSKWLEEQNVFDEEKKSCLCIVSKALAMVNYDFTIANIRPSVDNEHEYAFSRIYYDEKAEKYRNFSYDWWRIKSKEFAPEYSSDLATLYEFAIWHAYCVSQGQCSIGYIWNGEQEYRLMRRYANDGIISGVGVVVLRKTE